MTSPPQYPSAPEPGENYSGQPPFAGGPQQPQPGKGMTIAALVLGIVSVVLFFLWPVAIIAGILAIVFGAIGIRRANRTGSGGKGMAIAGLVLGIVGLIIIVVLLVIAAQKAQRCQDKLGHRPSASELEQCIRDGV